LKIQGSIPSRAKDFSSLQNARTGSGAHTTYCSKGRGGSLPEGTAGQCVKLTDHLHLVSRLRPSGTITLLPLHTFMEWTGPNLPFTLRKAQENQEKTEVRNISIWLVLMTKTYRAQSYTTYYF
jgi:hypothetical protein